MENFLRVLIFGKTRFFFTLACCVSIMVGCGSSSDSGGGSSNPPAKPTTPINFSASAINETAVNLTWQIANGNVTGYKLYRFNPPDINNLQVISDQITADAHSYQVSGLTPGNHYGFLLYASNSAGDSEPAVIDDYQGPQRPGTPTNFDAAAISDTAVMLSWYPADSLATGFRIYKLDLQAGTSPQLVVADVAANATSYQVNNLLPGVHYGFHLVAFNSFGDSGTAMIADYLTPQKPGMPSNLSAIPVSESSVNLTWVAADSSAAGFRVFQINLPATTPVLIADNLASNTTSFQVNNLTPGSHYGFQVVAYNNYGDSDPAAIADYLAPQRPGAPTNFTATAVSDTAVTLNWSAADTLASGFRLYQIDLPGTTPVLLSDAIAATTTSYPITNLTAGAHYKFQLIAYNSFGDSATAEIADYLSPQKPGAPTNFTATAVSDTAVTLNWSAADTLASGFRLYQINLPGTTPVLLSDAIAATTTSYPITNLTAGAHYKFQLIAYNSFGDSATAEIADYLSPQKPATPTTFTATIINETSATLSWVAADTLASGFRLYRLDLPSTTPVLIYTTIVATETSYQVNGLTPGAHYGFQLVAYNAYGDSGVAAIADYLSTQKPGMPQNFTATRINDTSATLAWTAADNLALGYVLSRANAGSGSFTVIATIDAPATISYVDATLAAGGSYDYEIYAFNDGGVSASAAISYGSIATPNPPATISAAVAFGPQVNVAWTGVDPVTTSLGLSRAIAGSGQYSVIATNIAPATLSYVDSSVTGASSYVYQIQAFNQTIGSALLTSAAVDVPALAQTPLNFTPTAVTDTEVRLSWTPADTYAVSFKLLMQTGASGWTLVSDQIPATATWYNVTQLLGATYYDFQLIAVGAANDSAPASIYSYWSPAKPPIPTNFAATLASTNQINLSWLSSGTVTNFQLARRDNGAGAFNVIWTSLSATVLAFSDTTVAAGNTYDYELRALNTTVASDPATLNIIIPATAPTAPNNLALGEIAADRADLTWWDNSIDEASFIVERAQQNPDKTFGAFALVMELPANSTSFIDQGANFTSGAVYQYRVSAKNVVGSSPSNIVTALVPPKDNHSFLAFLNKNAKRFQEDAVTAQAYYDAIDPLGEKTTVDLWKSKNGFGTGGPQDVPAVYVNDADLGFARRMYVNPNVNGSGNVASYVENYATLEDAKGGLPQNIIATVAMEYTEPALTAQEVADQRAIITQSSGDFAIPLNTFYDFGVLEAGDFIIEVRQITGASDINETVHLGVYFAGGTPATQAPNLTFSGVPNKQFISPFNIIGDNRDTDKSALKIPFNSSARQSIGIELKAHVPCKVTLTRVYRNIASAVRTVNGDPHLALNLEPGDYTVFVASESLIKSGAHTFTVSVAGNVTNNSPLVSTDSLVSLANSDPGSEKNPSSVFFTVAQPAAPATTVPVTIDLSMADPLDTANPILVLGSRAGTAVGPTTGAIFARSITVFDNINAPAANFDWLSAKLPAGPYKAVVSTFPIGKLTQSYTLNYTDYLTNTPLGFNPPIPDVTALGWVDTYTFNPYLPINPGYTFDVPNSGDGTALIEFSSETGGTLPVINIMGNPGDYRNPVLQANVWNNPINDYIAKLTKLLNAGTYTLVVGTELIGDNGTFTVTATDSVGNSLLAGTVNSGSWSNSDGAYVNGSNPRFTLNVPSNNTEVHIEVAANTATLPIPVPVFHLLDNVGEVVDQSIARNEVHAILEGDILAGDYQLVLTSDGSDNPYEMTVNANGTQIAKSRGILSQLDRENFYSPNARKINLTLTQNTTLKIEFITNEQGFNIFLVGKGEKKIVTFYTYIGDKGALGTNLVGGQRVLSANLDGRGEKFQPGVCNVCHGGAPKQLVNGVYPDHGDTNAGFLAWDMDLFKYDIDGSTYSRANLEPIMKEFNRTVLGVQRDPAAFFVNGLGTHTARNQMIYGWYGGLGLPNSFNGSFVPPGWTPGTLTGILGDVPVPAGADTFYLQVIKPTCRLCHVQRDTITLRSGSGYLGGVSFTDYSHFIHYKDEIEDLVYDQGAMPMALRTFDHFWSRGQGDLLATFLETNAPPFTRRDNIGNVLKPGRPVANAGPYAPDTNPPTPPDLTRYVRTNDLVTLNGAASQFAASYLWTVDSAPAGVNLATLLLNPTTVNPSFTPTIDGNYIFRLVVNDGLYDSAPAFFKVNASVAFVPVSFASDIAPIFNYTTNDFSVYENNPTQAQPLQYCFDCHLNREEVLNRNISPYRLAGTPLYRPSTFVYSLTGPTSEVYTKLLDRINFNSPLDSRILNVGKFNEHSYENPIGYGFDSGTDWIHFQTFLQWIYQGAPNN